MAPTPWAHVRSDSAGETHWSSNQLLGRGQGRLDDSKVRRSKVPLINYHSGLSQLGLSDSNTDNKQRDSNMSPQVEELVPVAIGAVFVPSTY